MSTHRGLIKRLYAPATGGNTRPLRTEAANALHELVAEVETLRAALAEIHAKPYRAEEVTARIFAAARGGGAA